jgi:hypothetical protein
MIVLVQPAQTNVLLSRLVWQLECVGLLVERLQCLPCPAGRSQLGPCINACLRRGNKGLTVDP